MRATYIEYTVCAMLILHTVELGGVCDKMKSLINSKISIMGFPWVRLLSYVTYRMSNLEFQTLLHIIGE